ncbi:chloramphenicol acetyltransferase [Scopulibacillus darangshiensis]|uniref:Chloramphenicol acetyltransferase n=1 Tax=Scopulibacillus darangshiensis TaxID=442528 RepID=A0A4R2P2D1_9BACL|nr:chloramphenicol acetyltransferase [Scopulibacillus darangshiensis]
MTFNRIDVDHWDRKPYFDHYMKTGKCSYSIIVLLQT